MKPVYFLISMENTKEKDINYYDSSLSQESLENYLEKRQEELDRDMTDSEILGIKESFIERLRPFIEAASSDYRKISEGLQGFGILGSLSCRITPTDQEERYIYSDAKYLGAMCVSFGPVPEFPDPTHALEVLHECTHMSWIDIRDIPGFKYEFNYRINTGSLRE